MQIKTASLLSSLEDQKRSFMWNSSTEFKNLHTGHCFPGNKPSHVPRSWFSCGGGANQSRDPAGLAHTLTPRQRAGEFTSVQKPHSDSPHLKTLSEENILAKSSGFVFFVFVFRLFFHFFFLFKYSWLAVLCQFLRHSIVTQSHLYIHSFSHALFHHVLKRLVLSSSWERFTRSYTRKFSEEILTLKKEEKEVLAQLLTFLPASCSS